VLIAKDDLIAGILNRNGLTTGHGNRWTRERVTSLRSHHRIAVYKPADDGIEPWLLHPEIQIGLQLVERMVHPFAEGDAAILADHRPRAGPSFLWLTTIQGVERVLPICPTSRSTA
jgi:hypothetical protein